MGGSRDANNCFRCQSQTLCSQKFSALFSFYHPAILRGEQHQSRLKSMRGRLMLSIFWRGGLGRLSGMWSRSFVLCVWFAHVPTGQSGVKPGYYRDLASCLRAILSTQRRRSKEMKRLKVVCVCGWKHIQTSRGRQNTVNTAAVTVGRITF